MQGRQPGIFYKEYYENPNLFIFAQSEDDAEGLVRFLEDLQTINLQNGYQSKILINAPDVPRNKLHHAMKYEEQLMDVARWTSYGVSISHCAFIKNHKRLDANKVAKMIHAKKDYVGRSLEVKAQVLSGIPEAIQDSNQEESF